MTGAKLQKRFSLNKTANYGDPPDTLVPDAFSNTDNIVPDTIKQVSTENSEKELIPPVRLARVSRDTFKYFRCSAWFGSICAT